MWAKVAEFYFELAVENGVVPRDADAIKQKFGRLTNAQKSTGDPTSPLLVRETKIIA